MEKSANFRSIPNLVPSKFGFLGAMPANSATDNFPQISHPMTMLSHP